MNVTRDVILDLIPLCHAGEASDDTRDLVAAFAAEDPEVAHLLTAPTKVTLPKIPQLTKEAEMHTLERTRKTLKWQTTLLFGALLFTVLAALFGGLVFYLLGFGGSEALLSVMLTWGPVLVILTVVMAFVAWAAYLSFRTYLSA